MELAKNHIDVGLFTNATEEMLSFWQQKAGLSFDHLLPVGGGVRQHRHDMNGSVMKINDVRDPLPAAPASGYRRLLIAREGLAAAEILTDPDGNQIELVPKGTQGIVGIGLQMTVRDPAAHARFYEEAMGMTRLDAHQFQCGDSILFLNKGEAVTRDPEMQAPGFRYITVQVKDTDGVHAHVLNHGGVEGRAPLTLGNVARISFVRDPDGNWIEISQRKSLTGSLD